MVKEHIPKILPFDQINWPPARPEGLRTLPLEGIDPMPRPQNLKAPSDPIAIEQTEQKCDRVLFILIGGAGDGWLHQNVKRDLAATIRDSHIAYLDRIRIVYFQNIKGTGLPSAVINTINSACEKYIVVIGHSWGTDDAIRAAASVSKKIDFLITLDPVFKRGNDVNTYYIKAKNNVNESWINTWVDIKEQKNPIAGNLIARAGGHVGPIAPAHQNIYLGDIVPGSGDHAYAWIQYMQSSQHQIQSWMGSIKWED